jgi:uncharacterized protein YjaZ
MTQQVQDPRIDEALELLNSSAKEKKDQIQQLISDKYENIKDTLTVGTKGAMQRSPWLFLSSVASLCLVAGYFAGYSYAKRY